MQATRIGRFVAILVRKQLIFCILLFLLLAVRLVVRIHGELVRFELSAMLTC